MEFKQEFYRLPFAFDTERLKEEVLAFASEEWGFHPQNFKGNSAIRLISCEGTENDLLKGPMRPTANLLRCPYVQQIMSCFTSVVGRSRLMKIEPGQQVPEHTDVNYYWMNHVRIHIPVITDPKVVFYCAGKSVHMKAGECWIFNNWKPHKVLNQSENYRVHLVIDLIPSETFLGWLYALEDGTANSISYIPYLPDKSFDFQIENFNVPSLMTPGELFLLFQNLTDNLHLDEFTKANKQDLCRFLRIFHANWSQVWFLMGNQFRAHSAYEALINKFTSEIKNRAEYFNSFKMVNGSTAREVLMSRVATNLFNPNL